MRRFGRVAAAAAIAAVIGFVLLVPQRGAGTEPPECWSYSGSVVPWTRPEQEHGAWFAFAAAVVAAVLVGAGWAVGRAQDV